MSSHPTSANAVTRPASTSLDLEDIQRGVLHQRPSPYVGAYVLLRIDNREAGRNLVRRLCPVIESAQASPYPAQDASISVGFTYQGLKALGVPSDSLASFAPEFRQGMAARAPTKTTLVSARTRTGTTTSAMETICADSDVRPERRRGGRTPGTRSITR